MENTEFRIDLPDDNPKTAAGTKKPPTHAIPPVAILMLGQIMAEGERKYGLMNWRDQGVSSSTYYDALMRHLFSWWDGQDKDPATRVSHLAHIMGCCSVLLDAEAQGKLNDDRPMTGHSAEVISSLTST